MCVCLQLSFYTKGASCSPIVFAIMLFSLPFFLSLSLLKNYHHLFSTDKAEKQNINSKLEKYFLKNELSVEKLSIKMFPSF